MANRKLPLDVTWSVGSYRRTIEADLLDPASQKKLEDEMNECMVEASRAYQEVAHKENVRIALKSGDLEKTLDFDPTDEESTQLAVDQIPDYLAELAANWMSQQ